MCSICRGTPWWCSRRAWAAASAARRRRATVGRARGARGDEDRPPGARAARPRRRHGDHGQAPPVPRALRGRLRRRRRAPRARGRALLRRRLGPRSVGERSCDRALFHLDNAYYIPTSSSRARREDERDLATPRSAASAGRRACWSSRRCSTASPARSGSRPERCASELLRGHGPRRTRRPTARSIEDNRIPRSGTRAAGQRELRRAPRGDRRLQRVERPHQARHRHHAGEVRHLVYGELPQPGGRPRRRLPRRHRAGEPRRHRDGAGAAHEDARHRRASSASTVPTSA
jgi:hypothetical protein